jgi:gamma-glutamyltranspeptidase/glutathione hydrolase
VEKLGSGKLTVAEVLEPAIRLAEEGFVISNSAPVHQSLSTTSLIAEFQFLKSTA